MNTLSDKQIQDIKAAAAERFDGRAIQIELDDPINAFVVVAPFDRNGFAAFTDAESRDEQTALHGAVLTRLLYPSLAEFEALRQQWAVASEKIVTGMKREAGLFTTGKRSPLDAKDLPTGLSKEHAAKLVEDAKGARLWSVEVPELRLSCVMQTPSTDVWLAARTREEDARSKHKGIIADMQPYVLSAVKWQGSPLEGTTGLLERHPALYWDLRATYLAMGGHGAAVRTKSI